MIAFPSEGDFTAYESTAARRAAEKLAEVSADINNGSPSADSIHIRDAELGEDIDDPTDGGDALFADYSVPAFDLVEIDDGTDGLAVDATYGLAEFDNDGKMENKTAVLYGFQFPEPDDGITCPLSHVSINTPNSEIGTLDLTSIDIADNQTVLIDNPLIVGEDNRTIEAYANTQAADVEFKPLIKVAEPAGDTVSKSDSFADSA